MVSVEPTVTWNVSVMAFNAPGATLRPDHVTVPPLSETVQPGAPPQLAAGDEAAVQDPPAPQDDAPEAGWVPDGPVSRAQEADW